MSSGCLCRQAGRRGEEAGGGVLRGWAGAAGARRRGTRVGAVRRLRTRPGWDRAEGDGVPAAGTDGTRGADRGVADFLHSPTGRRGRLLRGRDAGGESRGPGRLPRGWGPALHRQVGPQQQRVDVAFCCQKFPGLLKKESLRQGRLRSRWKRLFF